MKKAKVPKEAKEAKEPKPKIEKPITDAQKKKLEKCVEKLTKKIEDAGGAVSTENKTHVPDQVTSSLAISMEKLKTKFQIAEGRSLQHYVLQILIEDHFHVGIIEAQVIVALTESIAAALEQKANIELIVSNAVNDGSINQVCQEAGNRIQQIDKRVKKAVAYIALATGEE